MRTRRPIAALAAAFATLPALTNGAAAQQSEYTSVALESCQQMQSDPEDMLESGRWICAGYLGIPVQLVESDLRFFVSYGVSPEGQLAAQQTLPPFNYVNDTLEWRVDETGVPYATILRFFADFGDGSPERQVLVVTRIADEGGVCHIAYVNASANDDANALARQAADLMARNFTCDFHVALWIGDRGDL